MSRKNDREHHRLSERDIRVIATLIDDMTVELRPTWPKIIALAKTVTGSTFTRQALSAHQAIAAAYQRAVDRHNKPRRGGKTVKLKLNSDSLRDQKIAELEVEIHQQKELINALQDILVRFVGNAVLAGLTQERLEAPLKARAEWRSDVDAMAERTLVARRKQRRG